MLINRSHPPPHPENSIAAYLSLTHRVFSDVFSTFKLLISKKLCVISSRQLLVKHVKAYNIKGIEWSLGAREHSVFLYSKPSIRSPVKVRAQANEHPLKFCEHFEQKPNFAITAKFSGTIHDPYYNLK